MKLDALTTMLAIEDAGEYASAVEAKGFHGLWVAETQVDPLLPLAVASGRTQALRLGTAIAIAFARSPMVMAMDAWALQRASRGRLDLGLGTQVRAHVERRFAMPYDRPAARIREYVLALQHIWGAFQKQHPLRFAGEFYRFDLMSPFFDPGPIAHPDVKVYLAAVNEGMFRTAGEVADGIVAHPFSTASYLREVGMPGLARGLAQAGRKRAEITVSCPVFTLVDASPTLAADEAFVRQQIAFYGSTPTYRAVLAHHGWAGIGEQLSILVRRGRLSELPGLVTDGMVEAFVTRAATYEELGRRVAERYRDLLDRVGLYGDVSRIERSDVDALRRGLDSSAGALPARRAKS
jgi:probable F420-dependent oxidoreductase